MSEHEDEKLWERLARDSDEELAEDERKAAELLSSLGWVRPVRCKECKYSSPSMEHGFIDCWCDGNRLMGEDGYCSMGEVIGL